MLTGKEISKKVNALIDKNRKKTFKNELGVVLGINKNALRQAKVVKVTNFLKYLANDRLYLDELRMLADHYDVSLNALILSDEEFKAIQNRDGKLDMNPTETGTYIFIHKRDEDLLTNLLKNLANERNIPQHSG